AEAQHLRGRGAAARRVRPRKRASRGGRAHAARQVRPRRRRRPAGRLVSVSRRADARRTRVALRPRGQLPRARRADEPPRRRGDRGARARTRRLRGDGAARDARPRLPRTLRSDAYHQPLMATASILTIGNELVSGDVPNTNGAWLAKRLAPLGVETRLIAAVPDEIETIAEFVRREAPSVDFLIVTGGLGGTPDDMTREALAAAF